VKGSGSITDQVDNLLMVWRNKAKEDGRATGKHVNETDPDAALICGKQRNGEWEGRIALWYEPQSQQFVGSNGAPALDFASFPHHG
jgi:twinkle protein